MTDFPNGVSPPGAPSYASPLLDFSTIGQLGDSYYKGQGEQLQLKAKTAFRNGIPKTPDGQNDYRAMTDKMIELGDYGTASAIGNLGFQQSALGQTTTNPESPFYKPPAGGQSAPQPANRAAPQQVVRDERPARANNDGGFDPPSADTPQPAPQSAERKIAPSVQAEVDRRLRNGDIDMRARNFGAMMVNPYLKDYAKARLEAMLKDGELTPAEKERISGTTQYGANVKVDADNRTLTPGAKDTAGGRNPGESVAEAQERFKVEGANRTLTPGAKDVAPGPGGRSTAQTQADIKVDEANRTLTPTAKDTTPRPGESPAQAQERIKTHGSIAAEAGKKSVDSFDKDYRGLQVASQSAYNGISKAKLGSALTQQPGFYSGPLQPTTQLYQQFKSTFGSDPSSAMPQEAFQKVVTDMLTEQVKALGQSGVGRVLMVEVQNMQKSIASLGISPATNRVLLETVQRVYGQSQQLAEIARGVASDPNIQPQDKQTALDQAADNFYKQHPIFKPEEVADPRLIGSPTVPAGVTTIPAFQAWAKTQNLPSGYPVRLPDGKIKMVP